MWIIYGSAGFLLGVMFMAIVCSNRVSKQHEEIRELKEYICNHCTVFRCKNCNFNTKGKD